MRGVYLVCNVKAGGLCESNIHMNAVSKISQRNTVQGITAYLFPP